MISKVHLYLGHNNKHHFQQGGFTMLDHCTGLLNLVPPWWNVENGAQSWCVKQYGAGNMVGGTHWVHPLGALQGNKFAQLPPGAPI